jgi:hypothetical protein
VYSGVGPEFAFIYPLSMYVKVKPTNKKLEKKRGKRKRSFAQLLTVGTVGGGERDELIFLASVLVLQTSW